MEGIGYKAARAERRVILSFVQIKDISFPSQGEVGKVFAFMLSHCFLTNLEIHSVSTA